MGDIEKFLLNLIIKEKKLILTGLIVGFIFFLVYYFFFYIPLFSTQSNIYIKNILKPGVITQYVDRGTVNSESGYSNPLFNLYEVLKSENVAFNVYNRINSEYSKDLGTLRVTTKKDFYTVYSGLIGSKVIPSTDVLSVSLNWPDRKNAPEVLNIVIEEFKKENLAIMRSLESNKSQYLEAQTDEIAKQLEDTREKIKDYKIGSKVTNVESEVANLISVRISILREINLIKSQIEKNVRMLEEYAKQLSIEDPIVALKAAGVGNDPYLIQLSQQLALKQQDYARLSARFTDQFRDVIAVKNEIKLLKDNIEERKLETAQNIEFPRGIYDGPSTNIVTQFALVQAEKVSQEAQLKALEEGLANLYDEEAKLAVKQVGLNKLLKLEEAYAAAYQSIKAKQMEAKIKENEIADNLILLSSPSYAAFLKLDILTKFVGFLAFGMLVGFGIAYIKQGYEDKWSSKEELMRITGQPVLGVIHWLKDDQSDSAELIQDASYMNIASEIVSKAYTNDAFVLSFLASNLYQNKSVIIDNIAERLTKLDRSVIIIDFSQNFYNQPNMCDVIDYINQQIRFAHNKELGVLSSAITKKSINNSFDNAENLKDSNLNEYFEKMNGNLLDLVKQSIVSREVEKDGKKYSLHYLGLQKDSVNINDYISTKGFSFLIEALRRNFEFVLINTPHGNYMLPETSFIKNISEGIVLIASIDSNREGLVKMVKYVEDSGQKILGIITREKDTELEKYYESLVDQEPEEIA